MALNEEVLKTLIYADIFEFPLTLDETWLYLISSSQKTHKEVKDSLNYLLKKKEIFEYNGYFGLAKDQKYAIKREKAKKSLIEKREKAKNVALILAKIPSVLFVGISGGVAVGNVNKDDDIDLFIVTEKNSIWETRFLCVLVLSKHGLRRKRNNPNVKDKICLNMFLSESSLRATREKQDIYTAHEFAQLEPLFSRKETYEKLIYENSWIKGHMANFRQKKPQIDFSTNSNGKYKIFYNHFFKKTIKFLQTLYMRSHITQETVSDSVLAFHPMDYRSLVLSSYKEKILQYNLSAQNEKV